MAEKQERIVTGMGTFLYPDSLQVARDYKDDGKFYYKSKFIIKGAEAHEISEKLEAQCQHHFNKTSAELTYPLYKELDQEDGERVIRLNLKVKAKGKDRESGEEYDRRPVFLDMQGQPLDPESLPTLGNGTTGRVAINVYKWDGFGGGITLQPRSVMIDHIEEYTPRVSAEEFWASEFEAADDVVVGEAADPDGGEGSTSAANF